MFVVDGGLLLRINASGNVSAPTIGPPPLHLDLNSSNPSCLPLVDFDDCMFSACVRFCIAHFLLLYPFTTFLPVILSYPVAQSMLVGGNGARMKSTFRSLSFPSIATKDWAIALVDLLPLIIYCARRLRHGCRFKDSLVSTILVTKCLPRDSFQRPSKTFVSAKTHICGSNCSPICYFCVQLPVDCVSSFSSILKTQLLRSEKMLAVARFLHQCHKTPGCEEMRCLWISVGY